MGESIPVNSEWTNILLIPFTSQIRLAQKEQNKKNRAQENQANRDYWLGCNGILIQMFQVDKPVISLSINCLLAETSELPLRLSSQACLLGKVVVSTGN